jgi:hypothetical protein
MFLTVTLYHVRSIVTSHDRHSFIVPSLPRGQTERALTSVGFLYVISISTRSQNVNEIL